MAKMGLGCPGEYSIRGLVLRKTVLPDHSGPRTRYPSLRRHASCDIAVIGGGYSGALVAYYLTAAGADVVLVDRRNFGTGSTAASTALIEYQLDAELHEFIKLAGRQAAVRSYRLSRDAIDVLEDVVMQLDDSCDWKRKKGLHIASSPNAVKSVQLECRTRARHGFRVDFLTASELAARYAVKAPGALLYHDAAEVNPFKLVHALIRGAKPGYLRPYARTEIKEFEHRPDRVVLKTRRGFRIEARKVIFASGYESLQYLPKTLAKLVSTYALVSRPVRQLPRALAECLFTETMDPYLYVRTTADGRVMMGGEDEAFTSPGVRARHIPAKTRALLKKFGRWFPDLPLKVSRAWAGAFAVTADGLGYVDETSRFPNAHFSLGTGGNGMIFSVIAAGIICDLFLGKNNADKVLFRFDRPGSRR
ncbi:MAG: FAD-dependent oxidoreductase [Armatimonadota bacterium]